MRLTDLFLDSVARHGDRVAVDIPPGDGRSARQQVRYDELAAMADHVRRAVAEHVHAEALVVVLLPRETPWLYAAQLGVMWAGAGYVCLDESFPDAHIQHVVADAGAACVVTDARGSARFEGVAASQLIVGESAYERSVTWPVAPAPEWCGERSLAYAIYTSGTTGKPKAVLVEHRGVVNLVTAGVERFSVSVDDRISQNSSPAYDSSVEEVWLALAAGATLVVMDDVTVRSGPDLIGWLRRERVTILCPPPTLLRTMGCTAPAEELPDLRMCYVGGEALSEDLAELWGGALRLENGYGPTECTVTVVRGQVYPGEPVTIGTPVPPHVAYVLDERLEPVAPGEPGELCIAGPGLARGYLGNPDLTAEKFPTLPGKGRVYRTGDLVSSDERGLLHYHGRIDAQVKVRGYRIELEAIEAVLARCEGVREVAVTAQGEEPGRMLVAHVTPTAAAAPPDVASLRAAVARALPDYMVPARFAWIDELPRTVGGKVARKQLPAVELADVGGSYTDDGSKRGLIRRAFGEVLGLYDQQLGDEDDFFAAGGNSLRAAMLVSKLRAHATLQDVAVRDVYAAPTVSGLLATVGARAQVVAQREVDPAEHGSAKGNLFWFTSVQLGYLAASFSIGAVLLWVVVEYLLYYALTFSLAELLLLFPWLLTLLYVVLTLAVTGFVVSFKRLLVGRYEPGRTPAWGRVRLRHWLAIRSARLLPWDLIQGTELQSVLLRLLGAKVGKRVHIHRGVAMHVGGWDLLELGDDVTLGRDVELGMCELDDGEFVVGSVRIGSGATLEARASVGPDTVVGAGAVVRPLSFVPEGARIACDVVVAGVPATEVSGVTPAAPAAAAPGPAWYYPWLVIAYRLSVGPLLWMPWGLALWWLARASNIDSDMVRTWLLVDGPSSVGWVFVALVALSVFGVLAALLQTALMLRLLPKIRAGTFSRWTLRYWWASVRMRWLEGAGLWLSGTWFWPRWLRLAGARVAADVEVSSIHDVLPERMSFGGRSFLADGVYLGVPRIHRGWVTVGDTSLGDGTFLGNHVVIEQGQQLPDDLLLGVCTVSDDRVMEAGSSWFGLPAFRLPQREIVSVDERLTYRPGALRFANRIFWESSRFLLPMAPTAMGLWWFDAFAARGFAGSVIATALVAASLPLVVLISKWALLGKVRPGQHGLWSCWASRWDFHYVMWQFYGGVLTAFEGTLLLPWYLRAMGMRIGRRCVLGDGFAQVVDPDMITIEDGATVHALFQAHSFEDRVLKIDHVRLGARSTVGRGAVVLYGADVGEDAHVMPHSVVMKQERLLPRRGYAGAPTS
ncbi:MAG: amino acid adenylation domain-containing protein [Planctomycetota bacterium]|nr:amino acid adenylation domain-containing protein [Planctomycetota bacterium]